MHPGKSKQKNESCKSGCGLVAVKWQVENLEGKRPHSIWAVPREVTWSVFFLEYNPILYCRTALEEARNTPWNCPSYFASYGINIQLLECKAEWFAISWRTEVTGIPVYGGHQCEHWCVAGCQKAHWVPGCLRSVIGDTSGAHLGRRGRQFEHR
jgi:hypothetical protein